MFFYIMKTCVNSSFVSIRTKFMPIIWCLSNIHNSQCKEHLKEQLKKLYLTFFKSLPITMMIHGKVDKESLKESPKFYVTKLVLRPPRMVDWPKHRPVGDKLPFSIKFDHKCFQCNPHHTISCGRMVQGSPSQ